MLVTAGIVSRDLIRDWPGAPPVQLAAPPPPAYHYWYGHNVPPNGYHHIPPSMPVPYPRRHTGANEGNTSRPASTAEDSGGEDAGDQQSIRK